SRACAAGACIVGGCNTGFRDCNGQLTDGCETYVAGDVKNCGACGAACNPTANATAACVAGACAVASCKSGTADCDKQYGDGCEVDTTRDAKNCGACGVACGPTQMCVQGACVRGWVAQASGVSADLFGVWGSGANNVYAVGDGG